MGTGERFWTRRLRWRLRGAWMWPAFAALTLADALVLHLLPPASTGVRLIPAVIIAGFGNLFLVGAVAPWLARRLVQRDRRAHEHEQREALPPEVILDRSASILLAVATVGLVAAGLASRPLVVSETDATQANADTVRSYVLAHGSAEEKRNLDTANTKRLSEKGLFRTCVSRDDRRRAFCFIVDTKTHPVRLVRDPSEVPNAAAFAP